MLIIALITIIISCQPKHNLVTSNYSQFIVGNWAYVDSNSTYYEVYIDSINIVFYPENEPHMGPFKYSVRDNIMDFNDLSYRLEKLNCNTMRMVNDQFDITLEKIQIDLPMLSTELQEGFWLRRCLYLVNMGLLSVGQAYQDICNYYIDIQEAIPDEIIPIN